MLYEQLEKLILERGVPLNDQEARAHAQSLINKLKEGKKVQDSSAEMMNFLVHDLLDYS